MRTYDTATNAYISARTGVMARMLVWLSAKDRTTAITYPLGFWSGADNEVFTINGSPRTYYGAGGVIPSQNFVTQSGISVRMHSLLLSSLSPEIVQAIRGYDARMAPIEIHRALFDVDTHNLVGTPHSMFIGWVDDIKIETPIVGGASTCTLTLASNARLLTKSLAIKKSDETQKLRGGDRFRRWGDITGKIPVFWGEKEAKVAAQTQTPEPVAPAGGY